MLGVAIGAGGIGVAINGMIADAYSLDTALYTIPVLIVGAAVLMLIVRYPWNILDRASH
jgi:FSR family fosmidomycin resistance protein-like MFS transporter